MAARVAMNRRSGGRGGMRRGGGGAPAALSTNPADYGTVWFWLRGDDMTLNGADVASWNDKTGNGRHWSQGTAALQPAKAAASLNGRDGILFTATATEYLSGPNMSALTAGESFLVIKNLADPQASNARAGLWNTGSGVGTSFYALPADGLIYDAFGTNTRKTTANPTPALNAPRIYNSVSVAGEWTNYLDGSQLYTTAVNTVGFPAAPTLGKGIAAEYLDGWVWEWVVFSAKLTATNRTNYTAALKAYYGGW